MKKTIALITVAALVLVIAASLVVSAAPGQNQPYGPQRQVPTLTEAQKQELAPLYNQMIEIQKQITQKYVDFGYITQWQADQRNAWMQERMNQRMQNGFIPGMGRGPGFGPRQGRGGFGPGNGPCFQQQQPPAANQ
jgi:peptidoglycan hydrolase CwlO-like protein